MRALPWLLARVGGHEPRDAALTAEVRAELEHHLACARAELERAGLAPAAAAAEAERRFGARARIEAECLRVQKGSRLMGTKLHALLTVGLLLAVLALAFTLQRAYQTLEAERATLRLASQGSARVTDAPAAQTGSSAELEQRIRDLVQRAETLEEVDPAQLSAEDRSLLAALGYVTDEGAATPPEREDSRQALEQRILEYLERQGPSTGAFRFNGESMLPIEQRKDLESLDEDALRELERLLERYLQQSRLHQQQGDWQGGTGQTLRVGERLELIDRHGQLHATETVQPDGNLLVPEVGWVEVAGLTRAQAEERITAALEPYFVEIEVRVKRLAPITSFASAVFGAF